MRIMDVPTASPLSADQTQKRPGRIRSGQPEILGAHKRHSGQLQFARFQTLGEKSPRKPRRSVRRRKRLDRAPRHSVRFRRQPCAPRRPDPDKDHIRPGRARRAYRRQEAVWSDQAIGETELPPKSLCIRGGSGARACPATPRRTGADRTPFPQPRCVALQLRSRHRGSGQRVGSGIRLDRADTEMASRAGNEGHGILPGRQAWSPQPRPPRSPGRRGCRQVSSLRRRTAPQRSAKLAARTIEAQMRALRASR